MVIRKAMLFCAVAFVPGFAFGQASPSDFTFATRYDTGGRVTGNIAPDPDGGGPLRYAAVRNTYDAAGRLVLTEKGELATWQSEGIAPVNWSDFSVQMQVATAYDAMNRKSVERTSSAGVSYAATQYSYDIQGLLECVALRMNPAVYDALPSSACLPSSEGGQGPDRITRNEYDVAGQLLKVQKGYGTVLAQDYATYVYSPNGKRTSVKDANGNLSTIAYDGFDRQSQWNFPSKTSDGTASGDDYESYGYDANDNRTSVRRRDGRNITFAYDALNRVTSKIVPDGCAPLQIGGCAPAAATRDVYYGYDLRGLQTYARFDSTAGEGITTAYTGFGEIASSTNTMGGVSQTVSHAYDANGNQSSVTTAGGTWSTDYDGLDRPSTLWEGDHATSMTQWAYNAAGQRASASEHYGSAASWAYDAVGRLAQQSDTFIGGTGNSTSTLAYNPANQVTGRGRDNDAYAFTGYINVNRAYAVNGLNQYTTAGPAAFSYDANGNLISDGGTAYVYDAENRLVSASGTHTANLVYDPQGRLFETSSNGAAINRFLYDGDQLVLETDAANTVLQRYVHGPGEDDPVLWYEGGDGVRWYHTDHQGSIVALANGPSGTQLSINAYDDFGIPKADNRGRFQYTGQAWIPELGMYHYKARIYSPTLGRFLQVDPIGYKDQINLYAYVGNDPVNGRDPDGKQAQGPAAVAGCAIAGPACPAGAVAGVAIATIATACVASDTCRGIVVNGISSLANSLFGDSKRSDGTLEARSKTDPEGDPAADGAPHSVPDGKGGYTTYGPRDPITGKPESTKQYRPAPGRPHGPIERPNVKDRPANERPDGAKVPGAPVVRPPEPDEIPR